MSVFIIAEIGSVHDGSFGNALRAVEMAADAGADAVKFQLHVPAAETLREAPSPDYFRGEPRWDYFLRTGFSPEQWGAIKSACDQHQIVFMASPFSVVAADLLQNLRMQYWKIPSGEITNLPMLAHIARMDGQLILSSGMSSWSELDAAVRTIQDAGAFDRLRMMQCTSEYPCPIDRVGINVMEEMHARYGCPVGLSDHTMSLFTPVFAVARGAVIIEKHVTFSRRMYGSDAAHSLEPHEFRRMVAGIREAEVLANASIDKNDVARYAELKHVFEKSIVLSRDLPAGAVIREVDLDYKKPGNGISAAKWKTVIGRTLATAKAKDSQLQLEDLA